MPEYEFLEWQVQCANTDSQALQTQLAAEMAAQKLVNALHSALCQIDKQYTKVEQYGPLLRMPFHHPQRIDAEVLAVFNSELVESSYDCHSCRPQVGHSLLPQSGVAHRFCRDEMLAAVGGALGLVERLKESLTKTTKALNDHNAAGVGCRVMVPNAQLLLTAATGITISIEGKVVSVYAPRGLIQGSEDEMGEALSKAINSVRHAVQVVRARLQFYSLERADECEARH